MPVHHLMVGTWTPPGAIFTFAFDDEALTLELVHRTPIPEDEPISWMTFDHAKKTIYGAAMKKWSSFAVESPTSIVRQGSHPMLHHPQAASPDTNTRAIFLLAAREPLTPSTATPFTRTPATAPSSPSTARGPRRPAAPALPLPARLGHPRHGLRPGGGVPLLGRPQGQQGLGPPQDDPRLGGARPRRRRGLPGPARSPRWVAMHPSGRVLYVLMEKGNRLCECAIDRATRLPVFDDARAWPLIPPGIPDRDRWTQYRADVCALSASRRYLFASSRANSFDLTGYVAAFRLADDGRVERQICLNPTPTSGGHSNAVAPSDWSDEWLAITDDQEVARDLPLAGRVPRAGGARACTRAGLWHERHLVRLDEPTAKKKRSE
ncbi:hypothetical protein ACCO45_004035 [Purpureocillium lilacinum]|uniref:Uncharacterized protein n=1 Tax=Purpureocillium lilacinum TaxID=33203 RepID=A0ACC4E1N4_PURLI